jgi:hypothetical protein
VARSVESSHTYLPHFLRPQRRHLLDRIGQCSRRQHVVG